MSRRLQFGNRCDRDTQVKWMNISKWEKKEMNKIPIKIKRRRRKDQPTQLKTQKNKKSKKSKKMKNNPNNCDTWI